MADETFYRELVDSLYDGVYLVDRERMISYWNHGAERITGHPRDVAVGQTCANNLLAHVDLDGNPLCGRDSCPALAVMRTGRPLEARVYLRHADGHRVPVRTRIAPIREPSGEVVGAVEIFTDDSAAVAAEEEVERLRAASLLDPLTGIGNRRFIESELGGRFDAYQRYGWGFAVGFVDIDHFKAVNDSLGHATGDEVLRLVAQTLRRAVRGSDIVARWGGEEFVVVLGFPTVAGDLTAAFDRLRRLVASARIRHEGVRVAVTVSIGATAVRSGDTAADLVARADQLMYASKTGGRDRVTCDEPG